MRHTATRYLVIAVLITFCCVFSGCATNDPATTEAPVATAVVTDSPVPAPGSKLTDADLAVLHNGTPYSLMKDAAPVLSALGEPLSSAEAPSCVYVGMDKSFDYDGIAIFTNPDGDKDIVYEIIITSANFSTPRGTAPGASLDDVTAAYGEGHQDGRYLNYYITNENDIKSPRLCFEMTEDGVVRSIDIYYPTNISDE